MTAECSCDKPCTVLQIDGVAAAMYRANGCHVHEGPGYGWFIRECQKRAYEAAKALGVAKTYTSYQLHRRDDHSCDLICVQEGPIETARLYVQSFATMDAGRTYVQTALEMRSYAWYGTMEYWWA